ncbi:MAG: transposase, partial [Globicatella sulfidifaciens]|nr:transposase [Globicatella sulfidifaciens]
WDNNGFWLHYRRLERGRFDWPSDQDGTPMNISPHLPLNCALSSRQ